MWYNGQQGKKYHLFTTAGRREKKLHLNCTGLRRQKINQSVPRGTIGKKKFAQSLRGLG